MRRATHAVLAIAVMGLVSILFVVLHVVFSLAMKTVCLYDGRVTHLIFAGVTNVAAVALRLFGLYVHCLSLPCVSFR